MMQYCASGFHLSREIDTIELASLIVTTIFAFYVASVLEKRKSGNYIPVGTG